MEFNMQTKVHCKLVNDKVIEGKSDSHSSNYSRDCLNFGYVQNQAMKCAARFAMPEPLDDDIIGRKERP